MYALNDAGHNLDHILYVINRSIRFAEQVVDINFDMVFTIAAYHDIGHHIDAKHHEKVSADILRKYEYLRNFFSDDEMTTMAQAVVDHRSTTAGEPRSIYGRIVSSADRNTDVDSALRRVYAYRVKHAPYASLPQVIEDSRRHILDKFGRDGYARSKMYFEDAEYEKFLEDITALAEDEAAFRLRFLEVNRDAIACAVVSSGRGAGC